MVLDLAYPTLAFDPFAGRKVAPDSVSHVPPQVDELVERAYKEYRNIPPNDDYKELVGYISSTTFMKEECILKPFQIEMLLGKIMVETRAEKVNDWRTGLFLTTLMQNSHDYGNYNKFTLSTDDASIKCIGHGLKGRKGNEITLTVVGNVGGRCGQRASYSQFDIHGDAEEWCGLSAEYSRFNIHGDADLGCGDHAKESRFDIQGNTGQQCGKYANSSQFNIHGNDDGWCGEYAICSQFDIHGNVGSCSGAYARFSGFTVHKPKSYELLEKELNETNKLVLADDKGNVIRKREG